jgi:hypothetical protein
MGQWANGVWCWELNWRRKPFVWEEDLINQLMLLVAKAEVGLGEDSWFPSIDDDGIYSVKADIYFLATIFYRN